MVFSSSARRRAIALVLSLGLAALSHATPCKTRLTAEAIQTVRTDGYFFPAPDATKELILRLAQRASGPEPENQIRKMERADFKVESSPLDPVALVKLHKKASDHWKARPSKTSSLLLPLLQTAGYRGFANLHLFPSAAGNWRRGGGCIAKGEVPINLKESLSPGDWEKLGGLSHFLSAAVPQRIELATNAHLRSLPWADLLTLDSTSRAVDALKSLVVRAYQNPIALSPTEMKLTQAAVLSAATRYYVPIDFWTSRATHPNMRRALSDFYANYAKMHFAADPDLNTRIIHALKRYTEVSRALGETHLIGYQEELFPINPATGSFFSETELELANGGGAGLFYETLRVTGRLRHLKSLGIEYGFFQNIEVTSMDLIAQFGAALTAMELDHAKIAAIVLDSLGTAGGGPFWFRESEHARWKKRLIESVGDWIPHTAHNPFHNSNSFFYLLDLKPPKKTDFESKTSALGNPMLVTKQNAGDLTWSNTTTFIHGRLGPDFQEFKKISDYGNLGRQVTTEWRASMEELAKKI